MTDKNIQKLLEKVHNIDLISELREDKISISQEQINKNLGLNIKNYRLKLKLTIDEFSQLSGITATHLRLVERWTRGMSFPHTYKISRFIGISTDKFLFQQNPDYYRNNIIYETILGLDNKTANYILFNILNYLKFHTET